MGKDSRAKLTDAFGLFEPSVKLIKQYLGVFFVLIVIPNLLFVADPNDGQEMGVLAGIGGLLAFIFFTPLVYAETRVAGGHDITLAESFKTGYRYFWRLIGLAIVVSFIIFVGLLLFIIPGIIFARRYVLSPYYLVDQDLSIREAMEESATESKPFSWSIYAIFGVVLGIALLSIFGVVGAIVSTILATLYSLALPLRYFEVKRSYQALPTAEKV